jgi:DNA-binding NarL/FixJ family response regulator
MSNVIARKVVQFFQQQQFSDQTRSLSNREYEILDWLSKGSSYKEIGAQLNISALTVRTHISNIYEKLHVHSRTEAVLKYLGREP